MSEVTDLIGRYRAGELTLDELAERFRARQWPRTPLPSPPATYLEMASRAQQDPGPDVPESFDDVEAAFFRHDISVDEYKVLRAAMAESLHAEESDK